MTDDVVELTQRVADLTAAIEQAQQDVERLQECFDPRDLGTDKESRMHIVVRRGPYYNHDTTFGGLRGMMGADSLMVKYVIRSAKQYVRSLTQQRDDALNKLTSGKLRCK